MNDRDKIKGTKMMELDAEGYQKLTKFAVDLAAGALAGTPNLTGKQAAKIAQECLISIFIDTTQLVKELGKDKNDATTVS